MTAPKPPRRDEKTSARQQPDGPEKEPCDYCGVTALAWRKCKLICANCGNINKSCADL